MMIQKKLVCACAALALSAALFAQEADEVFGDESPAGSALEAQTAPLTPPAPAAEQHPAAAAPAEEPTFRPGTFEEQRSAIGVYCLAAESDGYYGLQLEHYFTPKFGLTLDGSFYYKEYYYSENPFSGNVNLQLDVSLFEYEAPKVFAYRVYAWVLGGARVFTDGRTYNASTGKYDEGDGSVKVNAVAGAGVGFEFILVRHISIPVQVGYSAEFPYDVHGGFSGGIGLRYRF